MVNSTDAKGNPAKNRTTVVIVVRTTQARPAAIWPVIPVTSEASRARKPAPMAIGTNHRIQILTTSATNESRPKRKRISGVVNSEAAMVVAADSRIPHRSGNNDNR